MSRRSLKSSAEVSTTALADSPAVNGHANGHVATAAAAAKKPDRKSLAAAENVSKHNEFQRRLFGALERLLEEAAVADSSPDAAVTTVFNNIWLMSEIATPIVAPGIGLQCGNFKLKYAMPEAPFMCWQGGKTAKTAPRARTVTTDSVDSASAKLPLGDVSLNVPRELTNGGADLNVNGHAEDDETTTTKTPKSNGHVEFPDDLSELERELLEKTEVAGERVVGSVLGKAVIHACFAMNQQGKISHPMIVFPGGRGEPDADFLSDVLSQKLCIDSTSTGMPGNVDLLLDWLPQFSARFRRPFFDPDEVDSQAPVEPPPYLVLLLGDHFKHFLLKNSSLESKQRLVRLCRANRILVFFYPSPTNRRDDFITKNIVEKFKLVWRPTILQFASNMKFDPNTQTGFVHGFVSCLRRMHDPAFNVIMCSHNIYGLGGLPSSYVFPANYKDAADEFKELGGPFDWLKRLLSSDQLSSELGNAFAANLVQVEQAHKAAIAKYQTVADSDTEKSKPTNGAVAESNDDTNDEDTSQALSVNQSSAPRLVYAKLSEQEVESACEWIDEMSKIGCLCIKYTFLRDLHNKSRLEIKSSGKEAIAIEKRWLDLVNKNQDKFKYKFSSGFNDDEHVVRWFDMDYWRVSYRNYLKKCKITSPEQVWTFEILHFPYQNANGIVRAPERDYQHRPRSYKPRISVIFAYSASGDYLPPYFVYPTDFCQGKSRKAQRLLADASQDGMATNETPELIKESSTASLEAGDVLNQSIETYARNGYVTSRVFEKWFTHSFLPYLDPQAAKTTTPEVPAPTTEESSKAENDENNVEMKDVEENSAETESKKSRKSEKRAASSQGSNKLLLYCGKLPVIDANNLTLCKEHKICLFAITDENTIPFNYLFVKSLRKRQTDLFLESWRKVTPRLNSNYQFKCNSRQQFYSVFMDAFQNCIEEIDTNNESQPSTGADNSTASVRFSLQPPEVPMPNGTATAENGQTTATNSATDSFRAKMASTFEQCELWPINEASYKKYAENLEEKQQKQNETKAS